MTKRTEKALEMTLKTLDFMWVSAWVLTGLTFIAGLSVIFFI